MLSAKWPLPLIEAEKENLLFQVLSVLDLVLRSSTLDKDSGGLGFPSRDETEQGGSV